MAWTNPRWGSLVGPDADTLRGIFESLSEWTRNPTFENATNPTIAGGGLVQVQPTALVIKNEWIESSNYASGSAGWRIAATGDAEFNGITLRGTLKTGIAPAQRIEIGTTATNRIDFYSGDSTETAPSYIEANALDLGAGIRQIRLRLWGGQVLNDAAVDKAQITLSSRYSNNSGEPTVDISGRRVGINWSGTGSSSAARLTVGMPAQFQWPITVNGTINGNVYIGESLAHGNSFAHFGHYDHRLGGGNYAIIQSSGGETYVNSALNKLLRLRIDNGDEVEIQRGQTRTVNARLIGEVHYGTADFGTTSVEARTGAGNWNTGFSWHDVGWRAGFFYMGTDGIWRLHASWMTWPQVHMDVVDMSTADSKENIRGVDSDNVTKIKKLKPIKFKRKEDPKIVKKWEEDVAAGVWNNPEEVEKQRKQRENAPEMFGFTAEEMAQVYPEATAFDADGVPVGIRYRLLVVPLTAAVQELTARLEALEAKK